MSKQPAVRVRKVMQETFVLVDGMTTVGAALREMKRSGATALIVKKRHEGDEYGLVLLSDIAKGVVAKDLSVDRVSVYEIMAKPVIHVHPEMDIRYCARLFESFGLNVAPVIEDGEVVGMVNYDSIVLDGLLDLD